MTTPFARTIPRPASLAEMQRIKKWHKIGTPMIEDEMNLAFSILVVEDDILIRDYVSDLLKSAGHDVTSAASGTEAVEVLNSPLNPDLLFTDIYMGVGMDGIELARNARLILPDIKILFSSGYIGANERDHFPQGAEILPKPYRRKDCLEKVMAMLEGVANKPVQPLP